MRFLLRVASLGVRTLCDLCGRLFALTELIGKPLLQRRRLFFDGAELLFVLLNRLLQPLQVDLIVVVNLLAYLDGILVVLRLQFIEFPIDDDDCRIMFIGISDIGALRSLRLQLLSQRGPLRVIR